ncbi:MAG: hypothetical protein NVS4B8_11780 [Herpetosiphon sp.]
MIREQRGGPIPGILGAGELAVLLGVAEEIGQLEHVELWTVAAGAGASGEASLRQLLRRYPFDEHTAFINLDHITSGAPVFATREGVLLDRRSHRQLLALASDSDAHDIRINAEPRPVPRRTLAHLLLQRGLPAITLTSFPERQGLPAPDVQTVVRCIHLVTGMLGELNTGGLYAVAGAAADRS